MEHDDIWRAIDAHRLRLTDELAGLSDMDWQEPSLCTGWTVRDVAAHLTLQQVGLREALVEVIRARGRVDRMIRATARRQSSRPTDEIIAGIRGMVGSRRHNVGVTERETLIDILVHSQDITVPLGRPLPLDPAAAAEAASRVWTIRYFQARKRLRGLRLRATDVDWSAGDGPEVRGPIEAILLVLTGRFVALPRLDGEGAAQLTVLCGGLT